MASGNFSHQCFHRAPPNLDHTGRPVLVSGSLKLSGPRFVAENMSGRCGVGQTRGTASGPQPLKATVPYQLASKARSHRRDGKSGMNLSQHVGHIVYSVCL